MREGADRFHKSVHTHTDCSRLLKRYPQRWTVRIHCHVVDKRCGGAVRTMSGYSFFSFLFLKREIRFVGKSFKAIFVMGQPRAPYVKKGGGVGAVRKG